MSDHRFDPLDQLEELFPDPGFTIERLVERRAHVRRRRAVVGGATATFGFVGVAALLAVTMGFGGSPNRAVSSPGDSVAATAPPAADPAPEPPVEFTVCAGVSDTGGQEGTGEQAVIPDSSGDITLDRQRDFAVPLTVGDIADPRLEGTWDIAVNTDTYGGPQGPATPEVLLFTLRIENDEGAWQGSGTRLMNNPGGTFSHWTMLGEGAYEGLMIAATVDWDGCPGFGDVTGYILNAVPEAPPWSNSGA